MDEPLVEISFDEDKREGLKSTSNKNNIRKIRRGQRGVFVAIFTWKTCEKGFII